jgi:hypothetical protein
MLKAIFGGKKEAGTTPPPKPANTHAPPSQKDQDFATQEKLVSIKRAVEASRQNVDNFYAKLEKKEGQIKELLKANKREEARRQITLFKVMKDQIVNLENLGTTLEKELIKLEVNIQSAELVKALKTANDLQKDQEKLRDDLENVVMDLKEKEAQENEIKNLLQELSTGTEEENQEVDNLMNQFERENMEEKMDSLNMVAVKDHGMGIKQPAQSQSISQTSSISYGSSKQVQQPQTDDLDDLLMKTAS